MLPAEIAAPIAKRLAMYVLRSKVKIVDESELYTRIGLAGERAAVNVKAHWGSIPAAMRTVEKDGAICVALGDNRFVALVPPKAAPAMWDLLSGAETRGSADEWEWTSIQAGIPTIVQFGRPRVQSTSTVTSNASTPRTAAERTAASMRRA